MTRIQLSERLYLLGLILLVAAMPLSVFAMSVSQFVLAGSWLIGGNIPGKIKSAFAYPVVAILAVVYFMHLVGGFYSSDYKYFFNDVRIKLPLLILPVLIYTSPRISLKWFEVIMSVFIGAVLISSIISIGVLYDVLPHKNPINDIRDISVFVSHIRLGLFICIAIFTTAYFLFKDYHESLPIKRIFLILIIGWFVLFLFILEAMTGVVILILTSIFLLLRYVIATKKLYLLIAAVFIGIAIPASIFIYIQNEAKKIFKAQPIEIAQLEKYTVNGREYFHSLTEPAPGLPYLNPKMQENGTPLTLYVCVEEMKSAWNKRSYLEYNGLDLKRNELKYTLARFLSSKGFRKDSAGVFGLSESEIKAIENGIPNVEYQTMGDLRIRLHKTIMEYYSYKVGENPTGRSLLQRLEYWKAGCNIFFQHPFTGVGTGDVQKAFNIEYDRVNSPLSKFSRHRAHNQYLTFALTFGIGGILFFLFSLIYPMLKLKMHRDYFYLTFFLIVAISMLTEDTLETQAGVTFFAFFNSFLLFTRNHSPIKND